MQYISVSEAKLNLAAMLDAVQSEPITIRRQNRDAAVVLSPEAYNRLRGLNIQEFDQFCDRIGQRAQKSGLTENELKDILS